MFVCPTHVFYRLFKGCCHPCLKLFNLILMIKFYKLEERIYYVIVSLSIAATKPLEASRGTQTKGFFSFQRKSKKCCFFWVGHFFLEISHKKSSY